MSKVKFNVNTEYAYLQNFKILQSKRSYNPFFSSGAGPRKQSEERTTQPKKY